MKFNFRKISAIGASILMAGMTMGVAAAAAYPAPFVVGGTADVAIVYGTGVGATDMPSVGNIQVDLDTYVTGGVTTITGDNVKLERSTNLFGLGEDMNDFYTSLDEEELSVVLAKEIYSNDNNDDFDYEQKITLGTNLLFEHFKDNDFNDDKPILGFKQATGDTILTYVLDFTPDAAEGGTGTDASDYPYLETTTIKMLGKEYYVSNADYTTNGAKLTLLDTANSAVVTEGESAQIAGKDVSISWIDDTEVKMNIDGEMTNVLSVGGTYKLSDGTYVGIREILYVAKETGVSKVELSLGTGKIVLEDGLEVEMNNEYVSNIEAFEGHVLTATIANTTTNIDSITLTWTLDDDAFLAKGSELTLPGFETIKISVGDFHTPTEETTQILPDGDDSVQLKTEVKEGAVSINLAYLDAASTAIEGLGEKATHKLVTNATSGTGASPTRVILNETENSYFVATWISGDDAESYVYEIGTITEGAAHTNKTELKSLVTDGTDKTFSEVGDDVDAGPMSFNLTASDDDTGMVTIDISATSGTVYTDRLVTKEGMLIRLPVDESNETLHAAGDGKLNVSATPLSFTFNVTEETENEAIGDGLSFMVNLSVDSTEGIQPLSLTHITTLETEDNSDLYEGYIVSPLATKVLHYKPSSGLNDLDIIYHGTESNVDVYVAESGAVTTITEGGAVIVKDTEVSSVATKNLIVVGGSCINSAAAKLLGSDTPLCGPSWEAATGVGTGQFLIKSYASSSITSKMALLVAGYEGADTINAATYLRTKDVDTSVGGIGTTSTAVLTAFE